MLNKSVNQPDTSSNGHAVSVIIPAYNQARYVTEAVESVLNQTYADFELVVVDDGSTDETAQILAGFQDSRIRVIRQENGGLSAARNTGIRESSAPLITLLDADDFFLPEKLAVLSEFLDRHLEIGMVSGGLLLVDPGSQPISQVVKNPGGLELPDLLFHNPYTPSAVMFRRSWLEKVGVFDSELRACEDWDVWLRMAYAGCRFAWVEQVLAAYRFHPQQMTREAERMKKAIFRMVDKFYGQTGLTANYRTLEDEVYASAWVFSAAFAYLANEVEKGKTNLSEALTRDPSLQENHNKRLVDMLLAWSSDPRAADAVGFLDRISANLPEAQPGLKRDLQRATGDVLLERVFRCPREERRIHRDDLMKAIRYKPDWLFNRGVLRILADAWLGIGIPSVDKGD